MEKEHCNIFPDEIQLYQAHIMTVIGLKSGKKPHKLGVWGHSRDLKVTLKLQFVSYGLQIFNRKTLHVEVISTTVTDLSGIPFPGNITKYVENVLNGSLGWVFMVFIHRLNIRLKPWFISNVKITIIYSQMRFHLH